MGEAWDSTIGKKMVVAVTGALLVGYVVLHMVGNLAALSGADSGNGGDPQIDRYGEALRSFGEPLLPHEFALWAIRVLLLGALLIHITGVFQLRARSRSARPVGHPAKRVGRSLAARTMMLSGPLLLAFIVFHILQFTTLTIDITPLQHGAIYANLYEAFQRWYFVLFYVLAVGALAFHLRHGVWSAFQTLGLDRPSRNRPLRLAATGIAVVVGIGFAVVPLAFWTGVLEAPPSDHAALVTTEVNR